MMKSAAGQLGAGEGHLYFHRTVVYLYIIDEPEIVYVDRNFGVVDGFQHLDDFFFDGGFVVHKQVHCWFCSPKIHHFPDSR